MCHDVQGGVFGRQPYESLSGTQPLKQQSSTDFCLHRLADWGLYVKARNGASGMCAKRKQKLPAWWLRVSEPTAWAIPKLIQNPHNKNHGQDKSTESCTSWPHAACCSHRSSAKGHIEWGNIDAKRRIEGVIHGSSTMPSVGTPRAVCQYVVISTTP